MVFITFFTWSFFFLFRIILRNSDLCVLMYFVGFSLHIYINRSALQQYTVFYILISNALACLLCTYLHLVVLRWLSKRHFLVYSTQEFSAGPLHVRECVCVCLPKTFI